MTTALRCTGLDAGRAGRAVVRGFDIDIGPGEVFALFGPNGAGKTTLLSTLGGLLPVVGGTITLSNEDVTRKGMRPRSQRGLILVPDDRALFRTLTVRHHLDLARRRQKVGIDEILSWFPGLERVLSRAAGLLSGGEQQQLALARALAQRPKVLLVDELSMGLAPIIVADLLELLRRIAVDTGTAMVIVEQHVESALAVADRAAVLVHGAKVLDTDAATLRDDPTLLANAYLGRSLASPG